jgi:hypothetical protein
MGGVAAALAACDAGMSVVLTEASAWLGGQMTAQGVSAFDEHRYIETFGGTARYYRLRERIRAETRRAYPHAPATMPNGAPLNPGDGWVSALCFEPRFGLAAIQQMLQPHLDSGRLRVLVEHEPVAAHVEGNLVETVTLRARTGESVTVAARYFLDATDLGDLLPLTGTPYVTGAEARAETGEPQAELEANPQTVQGFTSCFFVEFCPGERHIIPRPDGYERLRDTRPYTLRLQKPDGTPYPFKFFTRSETGNPPFWTYRRVRSGALVAPGSTDIALINWESNDYCWESLLDKTPTEQARIIEDAKQLSLGFLHWLQTEAPRESSRRDEGGQGYPELRLRPDLTATSDGLAQFPYIRESRRIVARQRILEQDISAEMQPGARAVHFTDTIGIGWYNIDVHSCVGSPRSVFAPTRPFQIPLGALLPRRPANLLAACKNLGVTHITNGAYRLHPVEWNIGEAAGALAAFCIQRGCTPEQVWASRTLPSLTPLLRQFQWQLVQQGIPLGWAVDVPQAHEHFAGTHILLALGMVVPGCDRFEALEIDPTRAVTQAELARLESAGVLGTSRRTVSTWQDAAQCIARMAMGDKV